MLLLLLEGLYFTGRRQRRPLIIIKPVVFPQRIRDSTEVVLYVSVMTETQPIVTGGVDASVAPECSAGQPIVNNDLYASVASESSARRRQRIAVKNNSVYTWRLLS